MKKRRPTEHRQQELLREQRNCCYYCKEPFGGWRQNERNELVKRTPVYDHVKNFKEFRTNREDNFVAACCSCNSIKTNKPFIKAREARKFVQERLKEIPRPNQKLLRKLDRIFTTLPVVPEQQTKT